MKIIPPTKHSTKLTEIFGDGTGDWPEDFQYENGTYTCKCCVCEKTFMGNKHRVVCKTCAESS